MRLTPEQDLTRKIAVSLRRKGLNPLPSRPDAKVPWMSDDPDKNRYKHLWATQAPEELFSEEGWPATQNIQLMTGVHWGLIAFDLDGDQAIAQWDLWTRRHRCPATWLTHSGGGGRHVWFSLPEGYAVPTPKGDVWRPDDLRDKPRRKGEPAIERLCDKSLVMFPPSVHPRTLNLYRFIDQGGCRNVPPQMAMPATAPDWVLRLPLLRPVREPQAIVAPPRRLHDPRLHDIHLDRDAVLDGVVDKVAVARAWGLRVVGPLDREWVPCRAIGRDDDRPSAAINRLSGVYADRGTGEVLSFFDIPVKLGRAHDWKDAVARVAERRY